MIVLDQSNDMVDVARYFMEFCMDESCGKCIPCRAGTAQLHRLLTRILEGSAGAEDMDRLEALCRMVRDTSLCGLGQTAPNPTLSTIRYFRNEYEAKLRTGPRATRVKLPVVIPDGAAQHAQNGGTGGTAR
jgi:bidirectional [NiFe] hydrogenase diaphorase subunit